MDTIINSKKFRIEEEEKKSSKFVEFFKNLYYKIYKTFANNKMLGYIKSTIALLLPILLVFLLIVTIFGAINVYVYEIFSNPLIYYALPALLLILLTPIVRLIEINYYDYLTSENNK